MTRRRRAKLVAGWLISPPTIGTNYLYEVTSKARPGFSKRFNNEGQAERWALANDVQREDFALAMTETA